MRICLASIARASGVPDHQQLFTELAEQDEVRQHAMTQDPAAADLLLFVDLAHHPEDPWLRRLRAHPLVHAYPDKVRVYDERDRPFATFPGIYVSAARRLARGGFAVGGPYPTHSPVLPTPEAPLDLLFSFQGARTHPVRSVVLDLLHDRGLVQDTSHLEFFSFRRSGDAALGAARAEFAQTIHRSKFVLCPRGHGTSSFRLYEVLSAGRVPVVLSDDWLRPPGIDWDSCVLQIPERHAAEVPSMLEAAEGRWSQMVQAGRRAKAEHLAPSRLWHHYASSLATLSPPRRSVLPWWAQRAVARRAAGEVRARLR